MEEKDITYWKNNCEENYITTPISVLRYISELEKLIATSSQTEKKYSKEDLKTAWEESESNFCGLEFGKNRFEVWFEQNKKD